MKPTITMQASVKSVASDSITITPVSADVTYTKDQLTDMIDMNNREIDSCNDQIARLTDKVAFYQGLLDQLQ